MDWTATGLIRIKATLATRRHGDAMADLHITPLADVDADEALVLARLDDPSIAPDEWRRDILARADETVVVARRDTGPLVGMARYRLERADAAKAAFHLVQLIAVDMLRPAFVASALMNEMLWRAREQNCTRFRVETALAQGVEPMALALAAGVCRLHSLF